MGDLNNEVLKNNKSSLIKNLSMDPSPEKESGNIWKAIIKYRYFKLYLFLKNYLFMLKKRVTIFV